MLPPRQPLLAMGPSSESVEMAAACENDMKRSLREHFVFNDLQTSYFCLISMIWHVCGGRELDKHIKYIYVRSKR